MNFLPMDSYGINNFKVVKLKDCCIECQTELKEFEKAYGSKCLGCKLNEKIKKEKDNHAVSYN